MFRLVRRLRASRPESAARRTLFTLSLTLLPAAVAAQSEGPPTAQSVEGETQTLAKKLSNPLADLVSLPLQFNVEEGVGPEDSTRTVLNFQPVVPLSISRDWNLIWRTILPIVDQPVLVPGGDGATGIGDTLISGFFSPAHSGRAIWGVGPVIAIPTGDDKTLGTGRWSAGPTIVVLRQAGPWTYGALANHLWSFAGDDDRSRVNQTFLQPFFAYAGPGGVTWSINSETTANWEAKTGERWTVPVNLSASKILRVGKLPVSFAVGGGSFLERPTGGPEWKLRTTVTVLLPRRPKPGTI
jgi:hypothetical protein